MTAQQWAWDTDGGAPWHSSEEMDSWLVVVVVVVFIPFPSQIHVEKSHPPSGCRQEPSREPCRKLAAASKLWFGTRPLPDLCQIFRFLFIVFFSFHVGILFNCTT